MGLEKIIDFILQFLQDFLPFFVTKEWEKTVLLRFGIVYGVYEKGISFKIPFADKPETRIVVTRTVATLPQTVVTSDGCDVTIKTVIKFSISDIVKSVTETDNVEDTLIDLTEGHNMNQVNIHTYEDCRDTIYLGNEISKKVRNDVKKYGVDVEAVTVTNFVKTRNYRLFNEAGVE